MFEGYCKEESGATCSSCDGAVILTILPSYEAKPITAKILSTRESCVDR